jgi:hypothetical protein
VRAFLERGGENEKKKFWYNDEAIHFVACLDFPHFTVVAPTGSCGREKLYHVRRQLQNNIL